jgi:hypothetical protein
MTQFDDIIVTPVYGPLTTSNYPSAMPYHSYGVLTGKHPNPPQFYPSQEPVYAEMNTNARHQYLRTYVRKDILAKQIALAKSSPALAYSISSSGRMAPTSSHTNYIPPIPSSMYLNILKSGAVGQTAYKVNLPPSAPTTTKSYYPSGIRTTYRRVRSGGCVAPKKKGAIENHSLSNGRVCAWGSIVRQNY